MKYNTIQYNTNSTIQYNKENKTTLALYNLQLEYKSQFCSLQGT